MENKMFLLIWMLLIILHPSCIKDLPIDPAVGGEVVVNCILTRDTIQTASVTRSVPIDESYIFREIENAEVQLLADGESVGFFEKTGYDQWELNYRPVVGISYQLVVTVPDEPKVTATTNMPYYNDVRRDQNRDTYPTKNFIQYSGQNPFWIYVLSTDSEIENYQKPGPGVTLKSGIGTDHPNADRFNQEGNLLDILPTATTPAFEYYIRIDSISDIEEDGISFQLQTNYGQYNFVVIRTASAEYDQYLKSSLQKMESYTDEEDPGQWFDERRIYSNVNNGTGIFAACADTYFFYHDPN
jgi:hypothetical protein